MNLNTENRFKNRWQPTASFETLKIRASMLRQIRQFFYERNVLEVEVPLLAEHAVTDPYNNNFCCQYFTKKYYLQTSPEYHMKRLLAAGSSDIYQLAKAFRHEEDGKNHNPEFTLLEWYRLGFSYHQLIDEVTDLIQSVVGSLTLIKISYRNLFIKYCEIDPWQISVAEMNDYIKKQGVNTSELELDLDGWLALCMSYIIEPQLKQVGGIVVVYDYPTSQSSLAQIDGDVAQRFEVYLNGIELANGFQELINADEQRDRFAQDNVMRKEQGKPIIALDKYFLSALEAKLPACSGVALGIDRLLMAKLELNDIKESLSFSISRA